MNNFIQQNLDQSFFKIKKNFLKKKIKKTTQSSCQLITERRYVSANKKNDTLKHGASTFKKRATVSNDNLSLGIVIKV